MFPESKRAEFLQIDDESVVTTEAEEGPGIDFRVDDWEEQEKPVVHTVAPAVGAAPVLVGGLPGIYGGDRFNTVKDGKGFHSTAEAREAFGIPKLYSKEPATHPKTGAKIKNANWVVNVDSGAVIGNQCVSDGYKLIQPEALDILDGFARCSEDKLQIVAGGTWKEDAIIWLQTDEMEFDGPNGDKFSLKALITNTYDRSGSFTLALTPMNVICLNYYYSALAGSKNRFNIRHTKSADVKVHALRQAFSAIPAYRDAVMRQFFDWKRTTVTLDQAAQIMRLAFGVKPGEEKETATRTKNKIDKSMTIYREGKAASPGDLYGVAQWVTNWGTHEYSKVTGLEGLATTGAARWEAKAMGIMQQVVPAAPTQSVYVAR